MLISLVLLTLAFVDEPGAGIAGRSLRSAFGWFKLLGGALAHFFAKVGTIGAAANGRQRIDRPRSGL